MAWGVAARGGARHGARARAGAAGAFGGSGAAGFGGLAAWREQGLREDLHWEGTEEEAGTPGPGRGHPRAAGSKVPGAVGASLAALGREVLEETCVERKMELTHLAFAAALHEVDEGGGHGALPVGRAASVDFPGRPSRPKLVPAKEVPGPGAGKSGLGAAAHMLHNLAHVELNAIDLAWDTVVRFSALAREGGGGGQGQGQGQGQGAVSLGVGQGPRLLPRQFYMDFARVADDEARHLGWCLQRLRQLGHEYGDMPAHGLLWEGARASQDSVRSRVVVIPCVQEARGLDAGPRLSRRLGDMGDRRSAAIVGQISEEEKAHVAVGVEWLRWLCDAEGLDPAQAFRAEVAEHCGEVLRGPFNDAGRAAAGLPREWYDLGRRLEDFAELEGAAAS